MTTMRKYPAGMRNPTHTASMYVFISICVNYNNGQVNVSGFAWEVFGMDRASRGEAVTVSNHELSLLGHGLEYLYGFLDCNHFLK